MPGDSECEMCCTLLSFVNVPIDIVSTPEILYWEDDTSQPYCAVRGQLKTTSVSNIIPLFNRFFSMYTSPSD
ncbi:hypothetical protein J6590_031776 [Homalodisca vitripennis]|nr:hypothetical protein J6590_031776 [Homalodisca vitripennis]